MEASEESGTDIILCARNLVVRLDDRTESAPVSFDVLAGQKVGIHGENGSGKTALLYALLALPGSRRLSGETFVFGAHPSKAILGKVGFVLQIPEANFLAGTVAEELAFGPQSRGWSPKRVQEHVQLWLERFGLTAKRTTPIERLCWGEKKLLAVASSSILQPELLILDDPFAGLGALYQSRLTRFLNSTEAAVLVTSCTLEPLESFCSTIVSVGSDRQT